jgi:hypothetical protein
MSWRRRNGDIDNNSKYSTQLQDHTNAINININIIYESYTIMGRRSDERLMKDAQIYLKEDRVNIIHWLIIHHENMKAETDPIYGVKLKQEYARNPFICERPLTPGTRVGINCDCN